jgi:AcrR family transcriptional regulator
VVATPVGSRRERARAATVEEIKSTARDLMREQGTTDVRFTDIARVMGMTAPALYRYYGDRDELLTELIADAYVALGEAIAAALEPLAIYDLPDDYWHTYRSHLEAVTPQDVLDAAHELVRPDEALILLTGDAGRVRDELEAAELGPLEVIPAP